MPGPRVELGTPASSGQRSTDELARRIYSFYILHQSVYSFNMLTKTPILVGAFD